GSLLSFQKVQRRKPSRIAASAWRSGIKEHRSSRRSGVLIPRQRSHRTRVEHEYVDATGRKVLHVGNGCLTFRAGEALLNGRDVVVVQQRYQMIVGGNGGAVERSAGGHR